MVSKTYIKADVFSQLSPADLQDVFEEFFDRDIESYFSSSVICCDKCEPNFAKQWPGTFSQSEQLERWETKEFIKQSRISENFTKDQINSLLPGLICPRCGESLNDSGFYIYEHPFSLPDDFDETLEEISNIAKEFPFLLLTHPFAKKVYDTIGRTRKGVAVTNVKGTFYRGRAAENELSSLDDFSNPPQQLVSEGVPNRFNLLDWFVAQTRTKMIDNLIKNARVTSSGRKLLTSQEKVYLVEEWQSSGLSCPEFCRRHGLIASQLYKWRKDANTGAVMGVKNEGELHSKTELEILRKENDELKKALGEATLDIKILKKGGNGSTTKQAVVELAQDFSVSINRVIAALGVARSSVYYKARPYPERKRTIRKQLPEQVKQSIVEITSKRATYGTPRVRAILKRDYNTDISKYMVNRYMKEEGLLLTRFRTRGNSRTHTGKISVEQPNTRWASDITSIKCWNGQKLRVAFVIDCCDRSIISWKAGLTMQGCDIELLVQEAIFQRFANGLPPKNQLQLLHDNGPEYIEKNLQKRLKEWNISDCHTPTYSPQSNGMCEALNGTFKRDYVFESCLDDPKTVMCQIQGWVDDYNNFAPHSALKMKTPKEYFIFKLAA